MPPKQKTTLGVTKNGGGAVTNSVSADHQKTMKCKRVRRVLSIGEGIMVCCAFFLQGKKFLKNNNTILFLIGRFTIEYTNKF
jgi:purine-cytosine permease-like protein